MHVKHRGVQINISCIFSLLRYEGTGRSLSLKLIQQLRQQSATFGGMPVEAKKATDSTSSATGKPQ